MKTQYLLWIPLALGGSAAALATTDALAGSPARAGDLAELQAEYDAAYTAWKTKFDATEDVRDRRALREQHPVHSFWDRFASIGESGEGRAYLWMLDVVKDRGLKRAERGPVLREIYADLLEGSAEAEWFHEAIAHIARDARYLEESEVDRWLAAASEKAKAPMHKALATLKRSEFLSESDDPETKKRGEKLLDEYERANVLTGARALDFEAATIDEHAFKLSDYRGKAVLIDFYGFW